MPHDLRSQDSHPHVAAPAQGYPRHETDSTPESVVETEDTTATVFPNSQAAAWIMANSDAVAEKILKRIYSLPINRYGPRQATDHSKSLRDLRFHLAYLSEALSHEDEKLFLDYIDWVKVLFQGLEMGDEILAMTLHNMIAVLKESMPAAAWPPTNSVIQAGIDHLDVAPDTLDSFLQDELPLNHLSKQYLDALLRGDRRIAGQMVMDALESGQASVRDLYLHVFQRSQHEIGRLWQTNQVSVAQEHYCTAATQLIMSQLYPYIFSGERNNRQMIAASIGGELHELGIRMVADFFEMEGWDTYYLGANTPESTILATVAEKQPDLLAISATITYNVRSVAQLITAIRERPDTRHVKILVGGYPFNVSPTLWRKIGADGYAENAQDATIKAAELVGLNATNNGKRVMR